MKKVPTHELIWFMQWTKWKPDKFEDNEFAQQILWEFLLNTTSTHFFLVDFLALKFRRLKKMYLAYWNHRNNDEQFKKAHPNDKCVESVLLSFKAIIEKYNHFRSLVFS